MKYLKSEIFYPLVAILIPGSIASFPWLIAIYMKYSLVSSFYDSNQEVARWFLLGIVIFAGIIVRDIGLEIEREIIDKMWLNKKYPGHEENWWDYLKKEKNNATIFDSISSKVVHLEFEIGSAIGLLIAFAPSIIILSHLKVACWAYLLDIALIFALISYLTYEACITCRLLSESRARLLGKPWKNNEAV